MQNYSEGELIGKGSYGKVYKVHCDYDEQTYVIKKVPFDASSQSEAEATAREAHVLSLLRHPHVVPYKEFFKSKEGELCLVMAYCDGGDLHQYIKKQMKDKKLIPEEAVWQWLVQLLLSLSYIHSKRILHRDVKTQNIFLCGGKVLLGDFGLAKQLQRTFEMARTPIGTPYYMAPEIFEEVPYKFKSDVWALGCVMYEVLTGKPAFQADSLSRVIIKVMRGEYSPMPTCYSSGLRDVISAMLVKDVSARPSASDLLTHRAVIPHIQAYLKQLSDEGPKGWATWRMQLPPLSLAKIEEALEAAGKGGGCVSGSGAAPRVSGSGVDEALIGGDRTQLSPGKIPLSQDTESSPEAPATPLSPLTPSSPASPLNGATLPRRPPAKLPPLPAPAVRTPYGLHSPFMGNVLGAAMAQGEAKFAELQVITQQVLRIRCGLSDDDRGGDASDTSAAAPSSPLTGTLRGSAATGSSSTAASLHGGSDPGQAAEDEGSDEDDDNLREDVQRLDQTLASTMLMTRKAVMGDDAPPDAGGLADLLPTGGFGFGSSSFGGFGAAAPSNAAAAAAASHAGTPGADSSATSSSQQAPVPSSSVAQIAATRFPPVPGAIKILQRDHDSFAFTDLAHLLPMPSLSHGAAVHTPAPPAQTDYQARGARSASAPNASPTGPSTPPLFAASAPQDSQDILLASAGQISLRECLATRGTNIRGQCDACIGAGLTEKALAAIQGLQLGPYASSDEEAALHRTLRQVLLAGRAPEAAVREALPLLEELAFLQSRMPRT